MSTSDAGGNVSNTLASLKGTRPLYFLPTDPFAEEILIPGFQASDRVDCMVGFFSSAILAELAPGLATYINHSNDIVRLIISPYLRDEDKAAIEEGTKSKAEVSSELLEKTIVTEDELERHTLRCLSYLLQTERIEIRIAIMDNALFHPKVWIFKNSDDVLAAHGSCNFTHAGIRKNFEQVSVSQSWIDPNQRYITEKLIKQFERLWNNEEEGCSVISAPQAIKDNIIRQYACEKRPTEDDFYALYNKSAQSDNDGSELGEPCQGNRPHFRIPEKLQYEDGPFKHQGKAVDSWCKAGYRGVLEMATGSGKTITSMICAYKLYQEHNPLLIVVAAPYRPLIEQWCEEITAFGLRPLNLSLARGASERARILNRIKRQFRSKSSQVEVVIISHRILCDEIFKTAVEGIGSNLLLIADEAHNLGSEGFISSPPEFFKYRLGLSATPVRQYDEDGTAALFSFFGPITFQFTLKEAIGLCLVEYDYFVHPVALTEVEMEEWYDLTGKIKANAWRNKPGEQDGYVAKLLRDRRTLLETAENKLAALEMALEKEDLGTLKHTLIYATDKAPAQLSAVNSLLNKHGILFHQLTCEETTSREDTAQIIRSFQDGTLRVLTAKRVLDEGVNIPQIEKAYILASTTVERQWVQRRGRLLRTCSEIGKTHSEIHDFISVPPNLEEIDDEARTLVQSELLRVQAFASSARNAGREDGPLETIHRLVKAAFL